MDHMTDAFLGNLLLIAIGAGLIYAFRLVGPRYLEEYQQEFFERPGQRMGWDVFWMILTRGGGAPVTFVFWLPVVGVILIISGLVQLLPLIFL